MTPPSRHASIWQTPIASACEQLLEHDPVVDVLAGRDPDRAPRRGRSPRGRGCRRGWSAPRSSTGRTGASRVHPGDRLADVPALVGVDRQHRGRARSPRARSRARRTSSSTSAPTFILKRGPARRPAPRGTAAGSCRRRSRASRPTSCRPGSRRAAAPPRAPRAPGRGARSSSSASLGRERVGDVAEVDERDDLARASCRASSFHSGLPARFATRSQTALTTAAVARWMTPFSGPIQRSWLSPTSVAPEARRGRANSSSVERPTTSGRSASTAATTTSLPRPIVNVRPWPSSPSPASVRSDHVRRRVVRVGVHRVRAVEVARRREADVEDVEVGDPDRGIAHVCRRRRTMSR